MATYLTLLSIVSYGVTYALALVFYQEFGVVPEDVGWSQVRAIATAALLIVAFIVLVSGVLGVIVTVQRIGSRLPKPIRFSSNSKKPKLASLAKHESWLAIVVVMVVILVGYSAISRNVIRTADRVIQSTPGAKDSHFPYRLIGVDLVRGRAHWTEPNAAGVAAIQTSWVYLLGSANGLTVFFDTCARRTFRKPTGTFGIEQEDFFAKPHTESAADQEKTRVSICTQLGRPIN